MNKDKKIFNNSKKKYEERDHRKIGEQLEIYEINNDVGNGLILWKPRGSILRKELQSFISKELEIQGYEEVFTPHIGKLDLFKTSGHFPYYMDSQFPPIIDNDTFEKINNSNESIKDIILNKIKNNDNLNGFYLLKPMNCPMHAKIFSSRKVSYKELPVRLSEYGTVYRWEQSGTLNGMTRVRGFTQDDAHIFCTEEQIFEEISSCLLLIKKIFLITGIKKYKVRIGLRNKNNKYIGNENLWLKSENILLEICNKMNINFSKEYGEAAFYGPKIDFIVEDSIEREWQLGTVQIDYNLPIRFNLNYLNDKNEKCTPVLIHRAPLGSIERFCGLLLEHFNGDLPTWLAPEQVRILIIKNNEDIIEYSKKIFDKLKLNNIRVFFDKKPNDSINNKIKFCYKIKIPHLIFIGEEEINNNYITVRSRINKDLNGKFNVDEFINKLKNNIINYILPDKI